MEKEGMWVVPEGDKLRRFYLSCQSTINGFDEQKVIELIVKIF